MRSPPDMEPIDDRHPRGRDWHKHGGRTDDLACRVSRSDKWGAATRLMVTLGVPALLALLGYGLAQFDGLRLTMASLSSRVDKVLDLHEKRLDKLEDRSYATRRAGTAPPESPL